MFVVRILRCCALMFAPFALTLAAEQRVAVHPPGPTSVTPIELHIPVTCFAPGTTVERVGSVIKVALVTAHLCDPPSTFSYITYLDPLPPGEYRVEVRTPGVEGLYASTKFVVRDGSPRPFAVHPFAIRSAPAGLRMWILPVNGGAVCDGTDCSAVHVRVGNAAVTGLVAATAEATFDAPALAPGLYDVTVQRGDVVTTLPAAVYSFGDDADISVFERVLFPVLADVAGANGSQWIAESVIANPEPWAIDNFNNVTPIICVLSPCGERLSARSQTKFSRGFYPHGVALLTPRPEAPLLALALRARDTSRAAQGFGTEIPVVREEDMLRNTAITLLDVPRDPRYRVKVRMYAFEPFYFPNDVQGRITIGSDTHVVNYSRECTTCPEEPAYAELDVAPGAEGQFSTIYVQAPAESFGWAFATVTNNVTQQVTVVTPNGKGGKP
jgi:hypothetical protein